MSSYTQLGSSLKYCLNDKGEEDKIAIIHMERKRNARKILVGKSEREEVTYKS
jgi:hypothetical protein